MPKEMLTMRDELLEKMKLKPKAAEYVFKGFSMKPGEIREQRRTAFRKARKPSEKKEAEIDIYEDMVQFRTDHEVIDQ